MNIDPQQIVEVVEKDVTEVLEQYLPPQVEGDGFALADPTLFARDRAVIDAEMQVAVVAWTWSGTNTVGLFGAQATRTHVNVRGVTLLTEERDEMLLHRFIDWLDVTSQIGLTLNTRPIISIAETYPPEIKSLPEFQGAFD